MWKEFILRGNVVDMAVGVIIGAAFGQIVTSFIPIQATRCPYCTSSLEE